VLPLAANLGRLILTFHKFSDFRAQPQRFGDDGNTPLYTERESISVKKGVSRHRKQLTSARFSSSVKASLTSTWKYPTFGKRDITNSRVNWRRCGSKRIARKPHMCGSIRTNPHFFAFGRNLDAADPHFTRSFPAAYPHREQ
jgi:hypothetical protein